MRSYIHNNITVSVSMHGNVFLNKKRLKQYNNGNDYMAVSIGGDLVYVQRVVCTAFHGEPINSSMQANHLNGIRWDNRARNLRWDTPSDNQKHAFRELGRKHSRNQLGKSGFKHHGSKPVDQIDKITGEVIKTFGSREDAAKAMNVDPTAIYNAIVKRNRVKYCRGFEWRYNPIGNEYVKKYIYENGKRKIKQI